MPIDNPNKPNPMFNKGAGPAGPSPLPSMGPPKNTEEPSLEGVAGLLQKAIDMLDVLKTKEAGPAEPPAAEAGLPNLRPPIMPR